MSSRFVSAGNIEPAANSKEDEWKKAQEAIAASQKRQEEATCAGGGLQEGGKTLFETLQANKAAKQEAFEESLRQKSQANFLNEDDEAYLENLASKERSQRATAAREAQEQLAAFRKQQEDAEKKSTAVGGAGVQAAREEEETWSISSKKRKKGSKEQDHIIKGIKIRKTSSVEETSEGTPQKAEPKELDNGAIGGGKPALSKTQASTAGVSRAEGTKASRPKAAAAPLGLGLGGYSSDEDE